MRPVRALWVVVALICAAALTGCATQATDDAPVLPQPVVPRGPGPATVATATLPELGTVLTDGKGYTLYVFEPDAKRTVSCTDACAGSWPPLLVRAGKRPHADQGARSALLGTIDNPEGGRVVTYNGWPLYTYASDVAPGQARGQALHLNGGPWYVIRPSGKVVVPEHHMTPEHHMGGGK